jgi:hypothetical protein
MPSVLLSPVGNGQQFFNNNGIPNAGGLIYTYQAGSSTLLSTYTTVNGNIANTNPIVLDAYGRTPSEIWMQTGFSYKLVIQTASAVTLQTLDNLYPILQSASTTTSPFTAGMIIIWSGSIGSIPTGWLICDGTNSTPDLRNRFIIGAGSTYPVYATGGSADSVVVSHTHTYTGQTEFMYAGINATHKHSMNTYLGNLGGSNTAYVGDNSGAGPGAAIDTNITNIDHKHDFSGTTNSAGVSGTNANLPPYYALCYIMKS